jgi:hypothetical protein
MSFSDDDIDKLGKVIDQKLAQGFASQSKEIDRRFAEQSKEMEIMINKALLNFSYTVTEPMIDNIVELLRQDITKLDEKMTRIDRRLDNISDHHSKVLDDHEKRIKGLESFLPV